MFWIRIGRSKTGKVHFMTRKYISLHFWWIWPIVWRRTWLPLYLPAHDRYIKYEFLWANNNRIISSLVERPSSDRKDPGSIPGQGSLSTFTFSIFVEDNKTLRTSTWKLSSRNWRSPYWKKNCSNWTLQRDNENPKNQKLLGYGNNRK